MGKASVSSSSRPYDGAPLTAGPRLSHDTWCELNEMCAACCPRYMRTGVCREAALDPKTIRMARRERASTDHQLNY